MPYGEAIKVLGLKHGESVENYERAFEEVRKHMQRLRDEADTPAKRVSYELELSRFEEAIQVAEGYRPKKANLVWVPVVLALVALIAAGAFWGPGLLQNQAKLKEAKARLPEAEEAVGARNWTVAKEIYEGILEIDPKSKVALEGLDTVETERAKERRMQVGFALGRVQGLIETRKWDEAEVAMEVVLEMEPNDPQLLAFKERMKSERKADDLVRLTEEIDQARREEQWQDYVDKTDKLAALDPENERLEEFREGVKEANLVLQGLRQQANGLYAKAQALDTGEYSSEALDLLREAQRIAPSEEINTLYEKMSSYVQIVTVPGDVETIAEALKVARPGDKVMVAAGIYKESLAVPAGVNLEGVKDKTVIEFPAGEGSVVVISDDGAPSRLTNLSLRHSGISNAEERFPVVLVRGAQAVLDKCKVSFGAGHGVVIIGKARCEISVCEVRGCGWDGVSVVGEGSEAIVQDSRCVQNFQHGLDVWDGGRVWVQRSRFQENGLTGILLTSEGQECRIESSSIERNREVGLVASSGVRATVSGNLISENMLGGVFAHDQGTQLTVTSNNIKKNGEAGLVVGKDVLLVKESGNSLLDNLGKQKWLNVDLSKLKPKEITKTAP